MSGCFKGEYVLGKYFGTDGFRGTANEDLTVMHAFRIGRFLGHYYLKDEENKSKIVIGKDTRRSGYMLEYALAAGICASGSDAYLLHVTTTPCVSFVARTEGFDCGVMISASHNPYTDNGIKIINDKGEKASEELIEKIEEYLDSDREIFPLAKTEKIGRTVDFCAGRNRYCGYLVSLSSHSYKGMKVGIDAANGSAWMLAKNVFDALGAKTYVINDKPDGFNINKDCGSTHIDGLVKLVKENRLDIGFAFDGDADRCLAVDNKGNVLTGDHILYMCAGYMKKSGSLPGNTVVATVMSNLGLFKALESQGIDYRKTDVGDRYVYEEMIKGGFGLGGEESGHIIFSRHATTGDGIITALKIMEVLIESKTESSGLCDGFEMYPQKLVNVRVAEKDETVNDEDISLLVSEIQKKLGSNGRMLLRKSGTEPVVRVMAEAQTEEECMKCISKVVELIKKKGYCVD